MNREMNLNLEKILSLKPEEVGNGSYQGPCIDTS